MRLAVGLGDPDGPAVGAVDEGADTALQAPSTSASATNALDADREAIREDLRESARADASLRLSHVVRRTIEGGGPQGGVKHCEGRTRIAVARLANAAGVEEALGAELVRGAFFRSRDAEAVGLALEDRGQMRMAVARERRLRLREARGRSGHAGHVLPHR